MGGCLARIACPFPPFPSLFRCDASQELGDCLFSSIASKHDEKEGVVLIGLWFGIGHVQASLVRKVILGRTGVAKSRWSAYEVEPDA